MTDAAFAVVGAFMSGGAAMGLIAWARERWRSRQPAAIESANLQATAQALATVSAARDELQEDNARLRQQAIDERENNARLQAQIERERDYYLAEIERIRGQLITALEELDQIKTGMRHAPEVS